MDVRDSWSSYATPLAALHEHSIACLGAGQQSGRMRPFRDRALNSYGLVIVTAGRGSYLWPDGREEPVEAPALIWLYPDVKHGYGPDRNGWTESWLLFGGASAQLYEALGQSIRDRPVSRLARVPAQLDYLLDLLRVELPAAGIQAQLRASVLAQRLVQACVSELELSRSSARTTQVIEDLEALAFEDLSVEERAERLGLSVTQVRDIVRSSTGLSPLGFVLAVRISRARTLIAETALSINEIAREVGFGDAAYFSRLFSQRVGLSPREFRRQNFR